MTAILFDHLVLFNWSCANWNKQCKERQIPLDFINISVPKMSSSETEWQDGYKRLGSSEIEICVGPRLGSGPMQPKNELQGQWEKCKVGEFIEIEKCEVKPPPGGGPKGGCLRNDVTSCFYFFLPSKVTGRS
jgi:hypothetical protein